LDLSLLKKIREKGYENPTEIQDKSIPAIMTGKDLVGIAGTGTGKTAAFLIPIIQDLIEDPVNNKALIVAPTRELANQILDEFKGLTRGFNLFASCLIGGNPVNRSIQDLKRTNHVVIGTPGRLTDMASRGVLKLQHFETLVLDEFDRMLDMGFVDEVLSINERMTNKDQTLLFSATMDKSIRHIVRDITSEAVEVMASEGTRPATSITQEVMQVPVNVNKMDFLKDLMQGWNDEKIILFCATKRKVDQVHRKLSASSIRTDMIHGDKTQRAREVALRKFKNGQINVLIATDVVARGIDVDDVSLVVNYEIPHDYTDYIHRIGRTGRAGKTGKAITLID
jgi:ATP-dependent RNA helicase RhlE